LLVEKNQLSPIQVCSVDEQIALTEMADVVTIDTEGWTKMLGFSLCFDGLTDGFYLPFNHAHSNVTDVQREKIYEVLHGKVLVMHNAVYDLRVLARNGFQFPEFQAQGFDGELWATEQKFIRDVMAPMIELGAKIDIDFCMKEIMKGRQIMDDCKKELGYSTIGPKALTEIFIDKLQLPVAKVTPGGKPSFDKDAMAEYEVLLEKLDNPVANTVLTYRGWQKTLLTT